MTMGTVSHVQTGRAVEGVNSLGRSASRWSSLSARLICGRLVLLAYSRRGCFDPGRNGMPIAVPAVIRRRSTRMAHGPDATLRQVPINWLSFAASRKTSSAFGSNRRVLRRSRRAILHSEQIRQPSRRWLSSSGSNPPRVSTSGTFLRLALPRSCEASHLALISATRSGCSSSARDSF